MDVTGAAEHPTGRRQVVGAAVVRGHGAHAQLLAARRTEPPALAGYWELPGGKVEPGESPPEALARELLEELAVSAAAGEQVRGPLAGDWPLGEDYSLRVFVVRLGPDERPQPQVHDELRWLAADEWDAVAWLPDDVAPIRAVFDLLGAGATVTAEGRSPRDAVDGSQPPAAP